MPKAAFHTLGCKVNQYDTEVLIEAFRAAGYDVVPFPGPADVFVVNTCTVTGRGAQKSRQVVRRIRRDNPDSVIAVTGCYAQVDPEEVAGLDGVDVVVGTANRAQLLDLVNKVRSGREGTLVEVEDVFKKRRFEETPIVAFEGRTRATLKIQEGCTQFCSYCIVPYARGPVRSRDPQRILDQVRTLVEGGYSEIVLTGIHLGAYGRDLKSGTGLEEIVESISRVEGLERLRLSSIEPTEISDRLIELVAGSSVVCDHFHIPLQSGSDRILSLMRRPYDPDTYLGVVERIRKAIPGAGITADVMVGFPGETEEDFRATMDLCQKIGFSNLHIFRYSRRRGTPAAGYPGQVSPVVKAERSRRLAELAREMASDFNRSYLGRVVEVLVEEGDRDLSGFTDTYVRASFPGDPALIGRVMPVEITGAGPKGIEGRLSELKKG